MQYYTKQQLQGAGRYTGKARVGNWNEDVTMDELMLGDYLRKREMGELKLDKFQLKLHVALAPVELSKVADDGYVHFGDLLQVVSAKNGSRLCTNVEDRDIRYGEDAFGACATDAESPSAAPCARSSFLIKKFEANEVAVTDLLFGDDVLHFGQKISIVANPMSESKPLDSAGSEDPLYLRSLPRSTTNFARFSREQEVAFTHQKSYSNAWVVLPPNPKERLGAMGAPVPSGVPVVIQHCSTGQNLSVEVAQAIYNDFGCEYEVAGHTSTSLARSAIMEGLNNGKAKADVSKMELNENFWVLDNGSKVATLPEPAFEEFSVKKVLGKIMFQLNRKGANGIYGLQSVFRDMDTDGSGQLSPEEFSKALRFCMIDISDAETKLVLSSLDEDGSGSLSPDEFVKALETVADVGKRDHDSLT